MIEVRVGRSGPALTPLGVAGRGLLAGLGASLVLSGLARALPPMRTQLNGLVGNDDGGSNRGGSSGSDNSGASGGGSDGAGASGGSHSLVGSAGKSGTHAMVASTAPADALAQPLPPGPEGLAEQFAFKIASGVFGVDLAPYQRAAGIATHLTYGSLWGALYALVQTSVKQPPALAGMLYGLAVWLVGPGLLVPAMKLMRPPHKDDPARTTTFVAGHVLFGIAVAAVYERLEREA
jgi:uncharacterized membrane protein YagU involved in acid resistance